MIFQGMTPCPRQPLARMNTCQDRSWFETTAVQIQCGHSDEENEVSEEILVSLKANLKYKTRYSVLLQTQNSDFSTDLRCP